MKCTGDLQASCDIYQPHKDVQIPSDIFSGSKMLNPIPWSQIHSCICESSTARYAFTWILSDKRHLNKDLLMTFFSIFVNKYNFSVHLNKHLKFVLIPDCHLFCSMLALEYMPQSSYFHSSKVPNTTTY